MSDETRFDILEELAAEARQMEPNAITVENHNDGDPTHWVGRMGTRRR